MISDYQSSEATDSGQCPNTNCPSPVVSSEPVSGAPLSFPSYVRLYSDVPGAVIHYTIDGTEPDTLSATYTEPILIVSSGVVLRAIAHFDGAEFGDCEPGSVASVAFTNPSIPFVFSYACDTPDNAGEWNDFTSNGNNDNHWQLQFTLAASTTIKRLELFQLDFTGMWSTGQVWSTDSPITIPTSPSTSIEFSVYPLLVFETAVQQWVAYQGSLGSFLAGTYTWDLYGDIAYPVTAASLFRLDIILDDGTKLSQIINNTCTVTPPLCPPPETPTTTAKCDGAVDVIFTGTVGQPYSIFVSSVECGAGVWDEVDAGTIDVSPKTVEISGLTKGCLHSFYVSIQEAGCGYKDSGIVTAVPKLDPVASIATNKTIVDPDEAFTISWNSRNIGGAVCGGCLDGQVSIDQSLGCKSGNVAGSQSTSKPDCGVYTYTVTGCNTCGTAIASVQVEVRCSATCSALSHCIKIIESIDTALCPHLGACSMGTYPAFCGAGFWAQTLFNFVPSECVYTALAQGEICQSPTSPSCGWAFGGASCVFDTTVIPNVWRLKISGYDYTIPGSPVSRLLWEGTKNVGTNAVGVYTKTGGCATGPTTFTTTDQNCPA